MKKSAILILVLFLSPFMKSQNPVFHWADQLSGSTGNDYIEEIAIDNFGNSYCTGFIVGASDLDPGPGIYTLTPYGNEDVFITKLDPLGNLVWAKTVGGTSFDHAWGISVDITGNVIVTGYFTGTSDFDPGIGTFNLTSNLGSSDAFLIKLDPNGNFIWAKQFGSSSTDSGNSVVTDRSKNIYSTGFFAGTIDFNPGPGTYTLSTTGGTETYILKLDSNAKLLWAKQIVCSFNDGGRAIALDSLKNVIVTGGFANTADLDPGPAVSTVTSSGSDDVYILKLDSSGDYIWGKTIGGFSGEYSESICVDRSNNIISTGVFNGSTDFDPGASTYLLNSVGGSSQSYISKLDPSGNFVWAKTFEAVYGNIGRDVCSDNLNNVFVTGFFQDTTDFDPGAGIVRLTSKGSHDVYIIKLDPSGNYNWVVQIGDSSIDEGTSIAVSASGSVYSSGWFDKTIDCDPDTSSFTLTTTGYLDSYLVKYNNSSVGITEKVSNFRILAYPIPFNEIFYLENSEDCFITISDILGKIIYEEAIKKGTQTINLRDDHDGIYFVKIIQEGKCYVSKIIKE